MRRNRFVLGALLLASAAALAIAAQPDNAPAPKPAAHRPHAQPGKQDEQSEGERVFERRCSNCHTAPEGFSPRIAGTVVRHMRVRASLSQQEEQALLRFFNP